MAHAASTNRRRFGRVLRIASAAVLVMLVGAWVVSEFRWVGYSYSSFVNIGPGHYDYEVRKTSLTLRSGQLVITWQVVTSGERFPVPRQEAMSVIHNGFGQLPAMSSLVPWFMWKSMPEGDARLVAGLGWIRIQSSSVGVTSLSVPFWLLCLLAATPLIWHALPAQRRARRQAAGLCVRCGYSRNGLTDAQACPECGQAQK